MRSESNAETMVPAEMTIEMPPAHDSGAPRSWLMDGHAAPSIASGNPKLMNAT